MCGIAGIIALDNNRRLNFNTAVLMTNALSHRGPDGQGFLFSQHYSIEEAAAFAQANTPFLAKQVENQMPFILGHRRLAIVDLSDKALQPMTAENGRFWIVFNGEIYNHRALRKELEKKGCTFITHHSDTEVLLQSYKVWGKDCLQKLNGEFAFCIYDNNENSFFIARDRLGIKPLFYGMADQQFFFCSDMAPMLLNPELKKEIDPTAISDYLSYMAIPAPKTAYKTILKLEAGHFITITDKEVSKPIAYWDLLNVPKLNITENQAKEQLLSLLQESSRLRMEADVEVGLLLSGGLDSSTTLALLKQTGVGNIKTFAIGTSSHENNEFKAASIIAKKFDTEHFEIEINSNDFQSFLPQMNTYTAELMADSANIPIYLIAKKAREQGIKVLLGGEGSDEILLGYSNMLVANKYYKNVEQMPMASLLSKTLKSLHNLPYIQDRKITNKQYYEKTQAGKTCFWGSSEIRLESKKQEIFSAQFQSSLQDYNSFIPFEQLFANFKSSDYSNDYLNWTSYLDIKFHLSEFLLPRFDHMSMAASVEGRVPFLDHNFVEFCFSIPSAIKAKNGVPKSLLKESMRPFLPQSTINGLKLAFPFSLKELLSQENNIENLTASLDQLQKDLGIFKKNYQKNIISQEQEFELWNIINLALWNQKIHNPS